MYQRAWRFVAVFMYGLRTHSFVASGWFISPSDTWYNLSSKRGPSSTNLTYLWLTFSYLWCLKLIKSSRFAKVMILCESGLATGNKCWSTVCTRCPRAVFKSWKIKWGYISGIVWSFSSTSCLNTTFWSPKYRVGPTGKWQIIMPSGCPLCSCSKTKSVTPFLSPN